MKRVHYPVFFSPALIGFITSPSKLIAHSEKPFIMASLGVEQFRGDWIHDSGHINQGHRAHPI